MKYTIFAPKGVTLRVGDLQDLGLMLSIPRIATYVASNVVNNDDFIVNRSDESVVADFVVLNLEFDLHPGVDHDRLANSVQVWAQRSRIAGVRGERLAIVGDLDVSPDGTKGSFDVRLGTAVFFNDRRATINVGAATEEVVADVQNLLPYINTSVRVTDDDGVLVFPVPATVDPTIQLMDEEPVDVSESLIELRVMAAVLDSRDDPADLEEQLDQMAELITEIKNQIA